MSHNNYKAAQISLDENRPGHRKAKTHCPYCKKREKTYTRFINWDTMQYLPIEFGRCDREINCGAFNQPPRTNEFGVQSRIPKAIARKTIDHYDKNNLTQFLGRIYGIDEAIEICARYNVGTANAFGGSTVFWQVDKNGEYRSGKVVGYGDDGKRKKGQNNWVHSLMNIDPFDLQQCLFGEHLLNHDKEKPVAIFESEKTALIYELHNPDFYICLSSCGSNGIGGKSLNRDKTRPLIGRTVALFPDASKDDKMYNQWNELTNQMIDFGIDATCVNWEIHLCEDHKIMGLDIGDILLASNLPYTPEELIQHEEVDKLYYFPF